MEIPRHWRLKAERYRLEGSACPNCGQLTFPPRPVCTRCCVEQAYLWRTERAIPCGLMKEQIPDSIASLPIGAEV